MPVVGGILPCAATPAYYTGSFQFYICGAFFCKVSLSIAGLVAGLGGVVVVGWRDGLAAVAVPVREARAICCGMFTIWAVRAPNLVATED